MYLGHKYHTDNTKDTIMVPIHSQNAKTLITYRSGRNNIKNWIIPIPNIISPERVYILRVVVLANNLAGASCEILSFLSLKYIKIYQTDASAR
jgi:hypothetical protein